ncbi:MAG: EcoRV family type II restriction endonuclease [Sedimentisphaerales bacterium]|nr:EcoRV family type II restriction endonuclease [Sedimentisphaerales bacterium]
MTNQKERDKIKENFRKDILSHIELFNSAVSTNKGDWIIKGFIDITKNIYTISIDTKVISKIMELLLFPKLCKFAEEGGYKMVLSKEQNFYPDISFIDKNDNKFAVDIKSTYRKNKKEVNGMTLGAFTGYFRDRTSNKNITFTYDEYVGHFVLGVIYSRTDNAKDERKVYELSDLHKITSVVRDFTFFVQEKYRIAADRPGSGNTKNIGSLTNIDKLINGCGLFAELGEDIFNDYWMYYLTKDMAKAIDLKNPPYKNLAEYKKYKKME